MGPLIEFMIEKLELPYLENTKAFVLTGAASQTKAASPAQLGFLHIMTRCLYAEMVSARIEGTRPNLKKVYSRGLDMVITRLKAYGSKWRTWCHRNNHTPNKSVIPMRHQDKEILTQQPTGEYSIHPELWAEAHRARQQAPLRNRG